MSSALHPPRLFIGCCKLMIHFKSNFEVVAMGFLVWKTPMLFSLASNLRQYSHSVKLRRQGWKSNNNWESKDLDSSLNTKTNLLCELEQITSLPVQCELGIFSRSVGPWYVYRPISLPADFYMLQWNTLEVSSDHVPNQLEKNLQIER